jgi:glucose/arabinose dehydrogenase
VPPVTAATSTTTVAPPTSQTTTPHESTVPSTPLPPATTTTTTSTTTTLPLSELTLGLEPVAHGFSQPVLAISPPGDHRLFVVDQPGVIWVIDETDPEVFLDIRPRVNFRAEKGLLGLAFPPDHAASGLFYVHYTDVEDDTVVAEFSVGESPVSADPGSERIVLALDQPAGNHNGGMIAFGPQGFLWIGLGDGGASDDRFGNGQRPETLLGTLLRIRVGPDVLEPYAIPADNPFADGAEGAPEVWAFGLRNPWRWAFDGPDLWVADVGQRTVEEVNRVGVGDAGLNYGWPIMEGTDCFQPATCDPAGLVQPVYEYRHDEGCSITGGFVYRGDAIPELRGHYFFSDYCSGFVRSIGPDGAVHDWTGGTGSAGAVTSFGVGADGELLVVAQSGTVDRIVRSSS